MKRVCLDWVLSLPLALIAITCSSGTRTLDLTAISPEEITHRVEMNNYELTTLRASGTISIESREFVGTGSITVALKRPDSILIKIEGPFGIDLGSMFLTRERFIYYDSHANRVIVGPTTRRNIRSLLRVDLDFTDVMELLAGTSSLGRQASPPQSVSVDNNLVLLLYNHGSSIARYWVDPEKFVVLRHEITEDSEEPILETRYGKFTRVKNTLLPRSIRVLAHKQKRGLALHYSDIELNKPKLDFSLSIPEKAKRIYW